MPSPPSSPEKRLLRKSIEWFLLAVCTFFVFFFLPVTFCDFNNTNRVLFLLIIASFSLIFFMVMASATFVNWVDRTGKRHLDFGGLEYASVPFIVLAALVTLFFRFEQRVETELKQHGRIVTGTITGKTGQKEYVILSVSFTTADGKAMTVKKDIVHETNNDLGDWTRVKLIYSERHPQIFRLFLFEDDIQLYTGSAENGMSAKALVKLIETDSAELRNALDALNYGWELTDSAWVNIPQRATLKVETDSLLLYKKEGRPYMNLGYELEPLGFKRTRYTPHTERVESPQYSISKDITMHQVGYTIIGSSCVITILKKRDHSGESGEPE